MCVCTDYNNGKKAQKPQRPKCRYSNGFERINRAAKTNAVYPHTCMLALMHTKLNTNKVQHAEAPDLEDSGKRHETGYVR